MKLLSVFICSAVVLFALFPLTDTDIWWHLACARDWVTTWTPVREPVVNVHEFFQQTVAFVYNIGGTKLLVAFKAILWGCVFALFLLPSLKTSQILKQNVLNKQACHSRLDRESPEFKRHSSSRHDTWLRLCQNKFCRNSQPLCHSGLEPESPESILPFAVFTVFLFIFRFQFEIRPVLFSLVFLGIYWNILPWIFRELGTERKRSDRIHKVMLIASVLFLLALQWLWCKCQGLYILGPILALLFLCTNLFESWTLKKKICAKVSVFQVAFVLLFFAMPFFHREGLNLFLYPFGLLDRLLGLSPSAAIFASEIAENRSPITLLIAGENVLQSSLMIVLSLVGIVLAVRSRAIWLLITAILALSAERNFVLFLPVFFAVVLRFFNLLKMTPHTANLLSSKLCLLSSNSSNSELVTSPKGEVTAAPPPHSLVSRLLSLVLLAFLLGLWAKSFIAYDSAVASQRVPVDAAIWMKNNPHQGRLFNDDRAGGYLAFVNPSDSTYIDGRFILKTADFFERYLGYSENPQTFLRDADAQNIDRVVLPLRYYARWNKLLLSLDSAENWHVAYRDAFFVVIDRTKY